ncbi:lipase member H-like [Choristoneura fumiferana]|uniref:lipase member H-like n=1 Tax=Choristoneura fumiferana TaxID=7141 RepID=UPI003D158625
MRVLLIVSVLAAARGDILDGLGALLPPFLTENFEELIKTAAATCKNLPLDILFARTFTLELPLIDMVEFTKDDYKVYRVDQAAKILKESNPSSLVLYVPGWWNSPMDESTKTLVEALLKKIPMVLVLDTRLSFCRGYVSSASRVNALAHLLYDFLKSFHKQGYKIDTIQLIGFSLGAHVVGITGKLVQKGLNKKLSRITALDPAKPCIAESFRLSKNDGKFVQVIHTSAGVLGLENPLGDLDVYVNGVDVKQPECQDRAISLECDHAQAWKLFAASVVNGQSFRGQKCSNWTDLTKGKCRGNETMVGYGCSSKTKGMFLYKSDGEEVRRKKDVEMKVFNPVEALTGQVLSWLVR